MVNNKYLWLRCTISYHPVFIKFEKSGCVWLPTNVRCEHLKSNFKANCSPKYIQFLSCQIICCHNIFLKIIGFLFLFCNLRCTITVYLKKQIVFHLIIITRSKVLWAFHYKFDLWMRESVYRMFKESFNLYSKNFILWGLVETT